MRLHLANALPDPARRVGDEILVGPSGGGPLTEAAAAAVADRGAERLPRLLDPPDKTGPRAGKADRDFATVLDEVAVGLADDEPHGEERDVAVGGERLNRIDDRAIGRIEPVHDFVGVALGAGPRLALVLRIDIR